MLNQQSKKLKKINSKFTSDYSKIILKIKNQSIITKLTDIDKALLRLKEQRRKRIKKIRGLTKSEWIGNGVYLELHIDLHNETIINRINELKILKKSIQKIIGINNISEYLNRLSSYENIAIKNKGLLDREVLEIAENIADSLNGRIDSAEEVLRVAFIATVFNFSTNTALTIYKTGDVYDALRRVNGNYENYSNIEIWWDMFLLRLLDPNALTGMVSLTKGAYFEQLVENQTGGVLFENFNNPDTDITIRGVEYQIKATNSESYIESVKDGIPIISTTEVAEETEAISSGISNEEISSLTNSALGGDIVSPLDAISTSVIAGFDCIGTMHIFHVIIKTGEILDNRQNSSDNNIDELLDAVAEATCDRIENFFEKILPRLWNFLITVIRVPLNLVHMLLYFIFIKILKIN